VSSGDHQNKLIRISKAKLGCGSLTRPARPRGVSTDPLLHVRCCQHRLASSYQVMQGYLSYLGNAAWRRRRPCLLKFSACQTASILTSIAMCFIYKFVSNVFVDPHACFCIHRYPSFSPPNLTLFTALPHSLSSSIVLTAIIPSNGPSRALHRLKPDAATDAPGLMILICWIST
jgi:hypothetical protein